MKWQIGTVEVHQLIELDSGVGPVIQGIIKDATPENIKNIKWLSPNFIHESGDMKALVQGFLVKSNELNILVDTCNGNGKVRTDFPAWGNLHTDFLRKLEGLGVDAENIDFVICTHMHTDHVGWNTMLERDEWIPTFPNARYIFTQQEYAYWKDNPEKELSDDRAAFSDSIEPIIDAELADLVEPNYSIDEQVSLKTTPGHTPGHTSVLIESNGKRGLISGDFLYHPCQIAHPEWLIAGDTYPEWAVETRKSVLEEIADTDTILFGSHFADPVAGKVIKTKDGLSFKV